MQQEKENFLGKKFLLFRKEVLGITQEALAERLGLTTAAVGSWERRGSEPTGKVLWLLIKEFGLNPDWLFFDQGTPRLDDNTATKKLAEVSHAQVVSIDLGSINIPFSALEQNLQPLQELLERIESIRLSSTIKPHENGK